MEVQNGSQNIAAPPEPEGDAGPAAVPPPTRGGPKVRQAFDLYYSLGPDKSLKEVARQLDKDISLISKWSAKYHWSAQVDALDAERERKVREASDAAAVDAAVAEQKMWRDRLAEEDEADYRQGQEESDQASLMRRWPLHDVTQTLKTDANGRATSMQVFKAAKWSKKDALQFAESGRARKAAATRKALGIPAAKVAESDKAADPDTFFDVPLNPSKEEPR
jgi:hypothetical protein